VQEAAVKLAGQLGGREMLAPTCIPLAALDISESLGAGAFGVVSRAVWRAGDASGPSPRLDAGTASVAVAVKRLELGQDAGDGDAKGFLMEACLLHALRHAHIVRLLGIVDSWCVFVCVCVCDCVVEDF
jgi:serine/threonine protein kinase